MCAGVCWCVLVCVSVCSCVRVDRRVTCHCAACGSCRKLPLPQNETARLLFSPPPSSVCPTADQESVRLAVWPQTPTVPSDPSVTQRIGRRSGVVDGAGSRALPEGQMFAEARSAVWTDTGARVHAGEGSKVFAETGILTRTGPWAEVNSEWRPTATEEGNLPSDTRDPTAQLGRQRPQQLGETQQGQTPFSAIRRVLAETPALGKPLGLLSKAAWTKSSFSSASKASSTSSTSSTSYPTTKASTLPSSSSLSSSTAAVHGDSQTGSDTVSQIDASTNSSHNNSSMTLGKQDLCQECFTISSTRCSHSSFMMSVFQSIIIHPSSSITDCVRLCSNIVLISLVTLIILSSSASVLPHHHMLCPFTFWEVLRGQRKKSFGSHVQTILVQALS